MPQLLHTLQRGAADGTITLQQAVSALSLRLEILAATPHAMLEHARLIPQVLRVFPAHATEHAECDSCELLLAAAAMLEGWGRYGAAKEALGAVESCGCTDTARRARYVSHRIAFGETGRVDDGLVPGEEAVFWTSAGGRHTRTFFMWIGGAGAAVHHNREALLALEDVDVELWLPLLVGACSIGAGDAHAALAALDVFEDRLSQRATRADPASTAFFHALRGRLQVGRNAALAEADFRVAMALVEPVANSLPWAYVMVLQGEALLRTDLDAADRIIAAIEASPIRQNFIVRLLMRRLNVARAMAAGQHDALQLAIQQHAETQEMLHRLCASPEEFAAVLRYWQQRWDVASGAGALASQRHSSALLDRFLLVSVMNRNAGWRGVLRRVGAAHHVGRALAWTDADLRYLRSFILCRALPEPEQAVIALPPFPPSREESLHAVIAAGTLIAEQLESGRERLIGRLRDAATNAAPAARTALQAAIGLAAMQDLRGVVEHHARQLAECSQSVSA